MNTNRPITSRRPTRPATRQHPAPKPVPVAVEANKGDVTIHRVLSNGKVVKIMF